MITIESLAELEAVSGGVQPADRIKCKATVSVGPSLQCEGSLSDFWGVAVDAFNALQKAGGDLGSWFYDVTHPQK